MGQEQETLRIGVLWRGDRQAEATLPRADRGLGPLYDAFRQLPVVIEPVPYSDDAIDEVREQLLSLDGVLVWVNPIQDGANRALLDPLPSVFDRSAALRCGIRRDCRGKRFWLLAPGNLGIAGAARLERPSAAASTQGRSAGKP